MTRYVVVTDANTPDLIANNRTQHFLSEAEAKQVASVTAKHGQKCAIFKECYRYEPAEPNVSEPR